LRFYVNIIDRQWLDGDDIKKKIDKLKHVCYIYFH